MNGLFCNNSCSWWLIIIVIYLITQGAGNNGCGCAPARNSSGCGNCGCNDDFGYQYNNGCGCNSCGCN